MQKLILQKPEKEFHIRPVDEFVYYIDDGILVHSYGSCKFNPIFPRCSVCEYDISDEDKIEYEYLPDEYTSDGAIVYRPIRENVFCNDLALPKFEEDDFVNGRNNYLYTVIHFGFGCRTDELVKCGEIVNNIYTVYDINYPVVLFSADKYVELVREEKVLAQYEKEWRSSHMLDVYPDTDYYTERCAVRYRFCEENLRYIRCSQTQTT